MLHSMGQGFSVFFSVLSSDDNETEIPSLTNAAACLRLAGVIRLSVPSSSSFSPPSPIGEFLLPTVVFGLRYEWMRRVLLCGGDRGDQDQQGKSHERTSTS